MADYLFCERLYFIAAQLAPSSFDANIEWACEELVGLLNKLQVERSKPGGPGTIGAPNVRAPYFSGPDNLSLPPDLPPWPPVPIIQDVVPEVMAVDSEGRLIDPAPHTPAQPQPERQICTETQPGPEQPVKP